MRNAKRTAALPLAALLLAASPPRPLPPSKPAQATVLHLTFEGLRNDKGALRICIWTSPEGFPNCKGAPDDRRMRITVTGERMTVDLTRLPPGDYGLSVFHDEDDDNRLDKALFGLPLEGVAFSNNASAPFGPPAYEKVRFHLGTDTAQTIRLRYYL